MKRNKKNELQAECHTLESNREFMNAWRNLYNRHRDLLSTANRTKNDRLKKMSFSNMNFCRNELRTAMGAVEIQLGMI